MYRQTEIQLFHTRQKAKKETVSTLKIHKENFFDNLHIRVEAKKFTMADIRTYKVIQSAVRFVNIHSLFSRIFCADLYF